MTKYSTQQLIEIAESYALMYEKLETMRGTAEDYAQLCAALADLRETALYPTPEDLPRDYVTMVEVATNPLAVVEAAKHTILAMRIMIDLLKMENEK